MPPRAALGGLAPVRRRLLVRGAVVWALVRVVATVAAIGQAAELGDDVGPLDALGVGGVLGVVLVTALLGRVDGWRRREGVLLTNLGVGEGALLAVLAAPAFAGELVVASLAALAARSA